MTDQQLTTIEQKSISFYDDELIAIRADDGHIYVSLRHLCDSIGLARSTQVRKIRDHDILAEGYQGGFIMMPPSPDGRGGGRQQAGLLRADLIPLWLTTITPSRVKEEVRAKIKNYQREAAKVLWEAFQEGRLTADRDFSSLLARASDDAVEAYQMAQAMVKLARNQIVLESRLDSHEQRLDQIEATLGDSKAHVTPDQAMQISQAVKTIAIVLGKQTKRNEFGAVYGEMYRKFGITSYKQLPARDFDVCMSWLTEWHASLTGDAPF